MRDAVIVEAVRTPVGRRNGGLATVHPTEISADTLNELVTRAGVDPVDIDDVMWGCVHQVAEQTYNIARNAIIAAGWPESVPGVTIDRQCGSSQQAVHAAAAAVVSGQADVVVALPHMGLGAEMIAEKWDLSRARLEEFALESHAKADRAQREGLFDREMFAVKLADGTTISADEGIRAGGSPEKLATLKTPFKEDGRITAATSSQISDGAAALLIMTSEEAARRGLTPVARIRRSPRLASASMTSTSSRSAKPSRPCRSPGCTRRAQTRPSSIPAAVRSRSATRWGPAVHV
jgi:acetyl-CoA acyltransferase